MNGQPLAIDLFCGLGGWTDGLLAEGYKVVGFDIERHVYGEHRYPAQLVLQDVTTLHGAQFKNAALIVASPPCQEYSYMAMPWSKAKAVQTEYLSGARDVKKLTALFDACFRIQREACEAAGRHIPMVVENVRGAQKWVGKAAWNFGSFYLWGDVPALMPIVKRREMIKVPGFSFDGSGRSYQTASIEHTKNSGGSWFNIGGPGQKVTNQNPAHQLVDGMKGIPHRPAGHWTNPEENGTKQGGDWFNNSQPSISRLTGSKSTARKTASAMIAKIPLTLSRHVAKCWYPQEVVGA